MSETHTSSNKLAVIHVLAGLITNPLLFSDNRYRFSITDFPEQFHRIIFGAVEHLATEGLASIQFIDIDEYLKPYTIQYEIYCKYDGCCFDDIQKSSKPFITININEISTLGYKEDWGFL